MAVLNDLMGLGLPAALAQRISDAIAGVPPASGAFTTITASTSALIGSGTLGSTPYTFQTATDVALAGAEVVGRRNMFATTLTVTGTTTNIWEGVTSFITLAGTGTANGEINCFHGQITIPSGTTVNPMEAFEAKITNSGTISGYHIGLWAISENTSTGTAVSYMGLKTSLSNANVAAGSVTNYIGWWHAAKTGAGTSPTNYMLIKNDDASAYIGSMGGIHLGSIAAPTAGTNLEILGSNTSAGTFPVVIKNSSSQNVFLIANDGSWQSSQNTFQVSATGAVNTTATYKVSSTQVVGARDTGWTAMTGSTDKATAYDTATVTLPQLAGRMMAIQAALTTHGLTGA